MSTMIWCKESQELVRRELGFGPGSSQYYVQFASDGKNKKFWKKILITVISVQIQATFKVNLLLIPSKTPGPDQD